MKKRPLVVSLALFSALSLSILIAAEKNRRAAVKKFDRSKTDKVFFPNLFQVLVGKRPENPGKQPALVAGSGNGGGSSKSSAASKFPWSKLIDPDAIENEIKSLNLQVKKAVTTPGRFRSGNHKEARILFTELAMLFAVIGEYDGKVRWQKDAHGLREMFARVARNTKAGGNTTTYQEARSRKTDLEELVRGSSVTVPKAKAEIEDWNTINHRRPMMVLLKRKFNEQLKPMTSNKKSFTENAEKIRQYGQLVTVVAEILSKKTMPDADSEEYLEFCKNMKKGSMDLVMSVKQKDDAAAIKAVGVVDTACNACHELYRN